jgi:hypothetical protein
MFRHLKTMVLVLVGCAFVLSMAQPAHATAVLALQIDGGAVTTVATGASLSSLIFNSTYTDAGITFAVTFLGSSSDNTAAFSDLLSSTTRVELATGGGTHTLHIFASSQDYTLPLGPNLQLRSGEGGTYINGLGAATFQAYADNANGLMGLGFTNGLQVAVPPNGTGGTFDTGEAFGVFTRGAGNYSLTTRADITLTGNGSALNYSNHAVVTSVPEPVTLSLLGVGLLGLAATRFRKRD